MSRLAFLLLAAALGLRAAPLHPTLDHTVMVGYQGWFRAPGDGSGLGWAHYQSPDTHTFAPGHLSIEYWPDLTEAAPEEKFPTAFHHADGSVASVFSSETPATIDRHFRWMADYGIDGAFVQRFAAPIIGHDDASRARLASTDRVLAACRAAAEHRGRAFTIMYDLTGLPADSIEAVIADWKHVIDDLHVRASPAWQHHRDRPLVAVWGVGFSDDRAYTVADTARLLDFLQNDPVYGGSAVLLGIPAWWRRQTADATADPALLPLLARADVLSPWTPGRIYDLGGVAAWVTNFWIPDRDWCRARGIDYLPVVFPGFSWKISPAAIRRSTASTAVFSGNNTASSPPPASPPPTRPCSTKWTRAPRFSKSPPMFRPARISSATPRSRPIITSGSSARPPAVSAPASRFPPPFLLAPVTRASTRI